MCENARVIGSSCAERIRLLEAQLAAKEAKLVAKEAQLVANGELIKLLNGQLKQTSELANVNEGLEIANADMKEQSQSMLKHFACMSHEIRTPLNCIVGMASLLLDTPMNQFQQEAVRMITASGDLLATVVDDVLDFSKMASGDFTLNIKKDVDLQLTLDSVTTSIQMKSDQAERGLWLRSYIGTTVPQYLDTDKQRLSQILYNLLGNAVKFSNRSGYIDLKCDIVRVNGQKWIRFQVKDYGKGIAKENYDKIFLPFQQVIDESGDAQGGTGLGLPITVKLVEKLGGRISVESQVGKWTEFTVEFPFHGQEAATFEKDALRLVDATVLVVVARPMTDCPVGTWMNKAGLGVDLVLSCEEMDAAATRIKAKAPKDQPHYLIVLMQNECFDAALYSRFAENHQCQLVTFGNKQVEEAAVHVQVPCRVFPSLFLPVLGGLVGRLREGKNNRIETTLSTSILVIRDQKERPRKDLSRNSPVADDFSNLNILIAEDNVVNQKVLLKTLNRLNLHNVDIVDNGSKAVHAASEKNYDLIFMDMEMPVMNGVDACLAINKTKRKMLPVIVFVTAHAMENFRKQASDAGGYGFVTKPFNLEKIKELMESIPWDILKESAISPLCLRQQLCSSSGLPFITGI